jgi:hypothetical protein
MWLFQCAYCLLPSNSDLPAVLLVPALPSCCDDRSAPRSNPKRAWRTLSSCYGTQSHLKQYLSMLVATQVQQLKSWTSFSTPEVTRPPAATGCLRRKAASAKGGLHSALRRSQHTDLLAEQHWTRLQAMQPRRLCVCRREEQRGGSSSGAWPISRSRQLAGVWPCVQLWCTVPGTHHAARLSSARRPAVEQQQGEACGNSSGLHQLRDTTCLHLGR